MQVHLLLEFGASLGLTMRIVAEHLPVIRETPIAAEQARVTWWISWLHLPLPSSLKILTADTGMFGYVHISVQIHTN